MHSLTVHKPADFVRQPPVETVAFGWGVSEDGQLVLPASQSM